MSNPSSPHEVEQQFHHLVQDGSFAEALDLVTREGYVFPDYAQKVIYYWRMTMACRLNKKDLALGLLEEAVRAGYWYAGLETDPDFQLLYGDAEFERLAQLGMEHRSRAMANAVPVVKTLIPDTKPPHPLLLALHGGGANVESHVSHWLAAVEHGWLVALPQSSQVYAPGTFTWNDWEWAQQEVGARYAALCNEHSIDPNRVVVSGFSQGGGLALWLVLSGAIKAQGLLLVGPFLDEVSHIIPLLEKRVPDGLRVYLVAGQRDRYCHGIVKQLANLLPAYGIMCKVDDYPDLEHSFPVDFEIKLPESLSFLDSDCQ
jgi:predicted esterase